MRYELGLFTRLFQNESFENMIKKTIKFPDIKYLELTANYGSKHINIFDYDPEYYLNIISKNNLKIDSLSVHRDTQLFLGSKGEGTRHFYPGSMEEQREYAKKVLYQLPKTAKDLGIKKIVGNIGVQNFSDIFEWPHKNGWKKQIEYAKSQWMPVLERFNEVGIKFAHEIGPQQLAYDLESSLELLETFENIESFGFCIDPSQILYLGINPSTCIEVLKDRIYNFHAKDAEFNYTFGYSSNISAGDSNRVSRGYRSRIPGWGDSNWKKIITSLIIAGYKGPLSIEIQDIFFEELEGLERAIQFLNSLK